MAPVDDVVTKGERKEGLFMRGSGTVLHGNLRTGEL